MPPAGLCPVLPFIYVGPAKKKKTNVVADEYGNYSKTDQFGCLKGS